MPRSPTLPHESSVRFVTDGGLETSLIFHDELDLPDFAAFPLLEHDAGRRALTRYYDGYFAIAQRDATGIVLDTPTWRANPDWGARQGYDTKGLDALNRRAVAFVTELAEAHPGVVWVIDGVIGPRGDGYVVGDAMTPTEAASYHGPQVAALAGAGADIVTAVTMTYADEAIGIVRAAAAVVPVVISFTTETDGRLPSGMTLREAIEVVDTATEVGPAYYMVNCAHPSHFQGALDGAPWTRRIRAVRANASTMSHEELDNATELDRGNPVALAELYVDLDRELGGLAVVGGCCGTDQDHVSAISTALAARH